MGDWTLVIHGTGAHHNGKPGDIDDLASQFIVDLMIAGQRIHSATLTTGSGQPLHFPPRPSAPALALVPKAA